MYSSASALDIMRKSNDNLAALGKLDRYLVQNAFIDILSSVLTFVFILNRFKRIRNSWIGNKMEVCKWKLFK